MVGDFCGEVNRNFEFLFVGNQWTNHENQVKTVTFEKVTLYKHPKD